jgi:8-oxo-dGTP pyrophosphatase MutT (NUDIX family)
VKLRESVRALILDENQSILLLRFDWDGLDVPGGFWANPGGGIEPGESRRDALARELLEEVGLQMTELGPEIWTKTALFPMAPWDGQVDHIHLLRVEHFAPEPRLTPDQLVAENVHEVRWWTLDELTASDATFAPRALPALLENLLSTTIPDEPVALTGF